MKTPFDLSYYVKKIIFEYNEIKLFIRRLFHDINIQHIFNDYNNFDDNSGEICLQKNTQKIYCRKKL